MKAHSGGDWAAQAHAGRWLWFAQVWDIRTHEPLLLPFARMLGDGCGLLRFGTLGRTSPFSSRSLAAFAVVAEVVCAVRRHGHWAQPFVWSNTWAGQSSTHASTQRARSAKKRVAARIAHG